MESTSIDKMVCCTEIPKTNDEDIGRNPMVFPMSDIVEEIISCLWNSEDLVTLVLLNKTWRTCVANCSVALLSFCARFAHVGDDLGHKRLLCIAQPNSNLYTQVKDFDRPMVIVVENKL